ncbi:MAG: putative ABC transport system ATP-binding protein [Pseudomonadales bacterium]|jgi:putative ABC transport system ATP-binding protein
MIKTNEVVKHIPVGDEIVRILNGVELTITDGESVAITGASGSGKSTLLGILAGLDVPTSGSVVLGDKVITTMNEDQRAQVRSELVGFVFQSFQLLPALTALENVMLPLELKGVNNPQDIARGFLDKVGLGQRVTHYPRQLSGGEQQRVAVARAFASQPKILFADEPTGNLDEKTGGQIIELLFALNKELGTTLVLVTHDHALAGRCDRHLQLAEGLLVDAAEVA